MARRHGRNARLYLALASGGTAEPIAFVSKHSLKAATDKQEVTAYGDANKIYVVGLPDASGSFSGFYDDQTVQTYTAAIDGVARKFYLYPDIVNDPAQYWHGTIFPDFSTEGDVAGAIAFSADWVAASSIIKVG